MKKLFVRLFFLLPYYFGLINIFYFITRKRQRVITYHNIIPDKYFINSIDQGVSCSETVFKYQLNLIAKKFNFTTEINKENSCVVTFDDGYQNNYEIALPILESNNINAVFFITYNLVAENEIIWVDLIMKWCSYVPEGIYIIEGVNVHISNKNRFNYFNDVLSRIYKDYSLKENVLSSLDNAFEFNKLLIDEYYNRIRFNPISLIDIENMKSRNHLIACHTISHDVLSMLSSKLLFDEINVSESYIGDFYNTNYFAYPFGGANEVSKKVLKSLSATNFKYCFVNYWNFFVSNNEVETIQRITLPNTTNKYLIHAYLSGFYFIFKSKVIHD